MEEQKLITLLQARDQAAIYFLYDKYGAASYGVILRIVGSQAQAEATLQASFDKIWQQSSSYDAKKKYLIYVAHSARKNDSDGVNSRARH